MKPLENRIEKYLKEHADKRVHPVAVAKKFNLFTHGAIVRLRRAGGCQLVILDIIVWGGVDPVSTYIGAGHAGQGIICPSLFQEFYRRSYPYSVGRYQGGGTDKHPHNGKRAILHRARAAKIYQHMNE